MTPAQTERVLALPCWRGDVQARVLAGGMTNLNFLVQDALGRYVVRLGEDLPLHGVVRAQELAVARAAHACGLSPEVVHAEAGVMVSRFIDGRTLEAQDLRDAQRLAQRVDLVRRCHHDMPAHLPAKAPRFQVFDVIRAYTRTLQAQAWPVLQPQLPKLLALAQQLEDSLGEQPASVFGHNDLLAANFIDDGQRLWLIDWDYAGFNTPLFDLANLAANNGFSEALDRALLAAYFGSAPTDRQLQAHRAMRGASMLREVFWGAVSHHHARVEFDYAAYTAQWLDALRQYLGPW